MDARPGCFEKQKTVTAVKYMKKLLFLLACGLLVGCDYTVPLVTAPGIEIDKSVLGLWQTPTEDGKTEQLLVLPLDNNEYLVSYPSDAKDGMFARACLCRTDDKILVQLKWFGTAEGKLPDDKRVFQFVSYSISDDKLTVRLLNSDVVKKDVASTKELAESIAANRDKPNLFKKAMVFTKVNK
jgi:hypothetical protein